MNPGRAFPPTLHEVDMRTYLLEYTTPDGATAKVKISRATRPLKEMAHNWLNHMLTPGEVVKYTIHTCGDGPDDEYFLFKGEHTVQCL